MIALIDADIVAFRCSASAENDPEEIAILRTNDLMRKLLHDTKSESFIGFLTGSNNFRYNIYPAYKANRKDKPRPKHLEACKELLIKDWKCKVTDGIEADDALGIEQDKEEDSTIICSIDKDLLQIPGRHYNFVRQEERHISIHDGWRNFYSQLITGDASDNVPAFDGKFRNTVPKFVQKLLDPLYEMTKPLDMYNYSFSVYSNFSDLTKEERDKILEELHRNASLIYIQKEEGDTWTSTIMDDGQQVDFEVLSGRHFVTPPDDGLLNTTL